MTTKLAKSASNNGQIIKSWLPNDRRAKFFPSVAEIAYDLLRIEGYLGNVGLGVVTATKVGNYLMKMTVTSRPRGEGQIFVRASAQFNIEAVSDPEIYQRFFDSLSQAMFLEANKVR
jgi:hypothetical protein